MANTNPNRRPPGTSAGGQFAPSPHPESEMVLGGPEPVREANQAPADDDFAKANRHQGTTLSETRPGQWEARLPGGELHDPDDGSPAVRIFHPGGSVWREVHYGNGEIQDPDDGSPAERWLRPDGSVEMEEHFRDGQLQDPDDGSPAVRWLRPDGSVQAEHHYQGGEPQGI